MRQLGLRERTRLAVRREIAVTAEALFVERGFEATTIDDIAAAVGMSQRSVFRYFASKEAIVLGKFDLVAEQMIGVLRARPAGEPVWTSLHHVLGVLTAVAAEPGRDELVEPIHRMIFESPDLFAGYLQKLQVLQDALVQVLLERAPVAADDPAPRALTGAAFACLVAAQRTWLASGAQSSFADAVERALATVGPLG
ncbi:TetR family transcriptional regulator [Cryptosporangium sp. NPDC051539]|uniref:TetR family transcriptional regulator n=1 Tax=Cryptosporangium sp. NPDC051539 TaxID=3363962 RepID=UPI0037921A7D